MRLSQLVEPLGGQLKGADTGFIAVSIDTRSLQPGDLYVAIRGTNFDGNEFVAEAALRGACAAVVSRGSDVALPQLLVADTRRALGKLGQLNRLASPARIIGITGSQGKTTVKEMTGAILAVAGKTLVTKGNLNNDIGVPLTLLQLEKSHRYGVIEMGANHAGEIAYSVDLVRPDVAVITNAARAHIEGFGSLDGVALGKGEIIDGVRPGGTMVLNRDDRYFESWLRRAAGRHAVSFSIDNAQADYFASDLSDGEQKGLRFKLHTPAGEQTVTLNLSGRHNVGNAVAAAALALEAGAGPDAVRRGLESVMPVKGRLCPVDNDTGARLIDDSYNASPESFKAAIDVLAGLSGQRILLMGDMAELGDITLSAHRELGEYAHQAGVDELWSLGQSSRESSRLFGQGGRHFRDRDEVISHCRSNLREGMTILIKGSRSAGLDQVVRALESDRNVGTGEK